MSSNPKDPVARISISLPESLLRQLDEMVGSRGFESRSQGIADMIGSQLAQYLQDKGEEIMAGTITLVYDHATPGLQSTLADIQYAYLDEVVSSLHVYLTNAHTMEVILVQGPAGKLQTIADKLVTCRGVRTGKLHLTAAILPPLHPLPV